MGYAQNPYGEIQDAMARQLDAVYAPVPVYFEAIAQAGDGEETEQVGDYIFVDIVPAGLETIGPYRTDMSVLIDIAFHKKNATNREYRELAVEIDLLFRPVFRFGGRAITVHNASPKIVDKVLHYSFTIRWIPNYTIPVEEGLQLMGGLAATITIET